MNSRSDDFSWTGDQGAVDVPDERGIGGPRATLPRALVWWAARAVATLGLVTIAQSVVGRSFDEWLWWAAVVGAGALVVLVMSTMSARAEWTLVAWVRMSRHGGFLLVLALGACVVIFGASVEGVSAMVLVGAAALGEEFLFRWLPVVWQIGRRRTDMPATLVMGTASVCTFVATHLGSSPLTILDQVLFACIAYLVCLTSGDVWAPTAYHMLVNAWAAWCAGVGISEDALRAIVLLGSLGIGGCCYFFVKFDSQQNGGRLVGACFDKH